MGVKAPASRPKQTTQKSTGNAGKAQHTQKSQANTKAAEAKPSDAAKQNDKVDANNHDLKSKDLSDREKEIQNAISESDGTVDIKDGDKVGNYSRAISDKDGNGELDQTEKDGLQANTKALLDKNPDLAKLAKENGLDPNNPDDLDAIMQLKVEESGLVAGKDKIAIPDKTEAAKAQEDINKNNEELPPPPASEDPAAAGGDEEAKEGGGCGGGGKCGGGGGCDKAGQAGEAGDAQKAASDIDKLIQEGYAAIQSGDYATAIQKFTQAISVGTQQLANEVKTGANKKNTATPDAQKAGSSLTPAQQQVALQSLTKSDTSGTIQSAIAQAPGNEKIQQLLGKIAYAQRGLEMAQQKSKSDVKKQTGGDPNAQQGLLALNNKLNLPQFKAA